MQEITSNNIKQRRQTTIHVLVEAILCMVWSSQTQGAAEYSRRVSEIMWTIVLENMLLPKEIETSQRRKTALEGRLAGYYRRFIEGFLKIAKSMTKLTQKGVKFEIGSDKEKPRFQFNKADVVSSTFWKWGKLNPRYVGPFKVLEKVGVIAYKLELPQELSRVHNTFPCTNLEEVLRRRTISHPVDGLPY
ncbi:hypothetical protein Tco_0600629 [Tanacetum coccineum]